MAPRLAVLETAGSTPGYTTTRVVELPSGRERLVAHGVSAGVAFAPSDARLVLAITPVNIGQAYAHALIVYDMATDRREEIVLTEPGVRPFFARGGAVVGYETRGGLGFVRLADGHALSVRGYERRGACRLYATTCEGSFVGDAEGGLAI